MERKYLILILILFTVFAGSSTGAQVRDTDIVLSIFPQYPGPNQDVNAVLNSYVTDLDKANISWFMDNQEASTGIGKKSFSFRTGTSGVSSNLSAMIDTIDGQSVVKTINITTAGVDLLWEAYDSYTPPFYKGKALVPSQGAFKVIAIPSLTTQNGNINMNNLSYAWTKDGKLQTNSSGWGKNYFTFQNSYLDKNNEVKVVVSDITGSMNASGNIILKTANPKIIFYKNDPSLGTLWQGALNNGFTVSPDGETFVAEPYFFSPKNIDSSNLSIDWFLNGEKTQAPGRKNILAIRPEGGQSG